MLLFLPAPPPSCPFTISCVYHMPSFFVTSYFSAPLLFSYCIGSVLLYGSVLFAFPPLPSVLVRCCLVLSLSSLSLPSLLILPFSSFSNDPRTRSSDRGGAVPCPLPGLHADELRRETHQKFENGTGPGGGGTGEGEQREGEGRTFGGVAKPGWPSSIGIGEGEEGCATPEGSGIG